MTNKIRPKLCEKAFPSITLNILSHSIKKPVVFFFKAGFSFQKNIFVFKKAHMPPTESPGCPLLPFKPFSPC